MSGTTTARGPIVVGAKGRAMPRRSAREEEWRRIYLGVRGKFLLALLIAASWTALSVWLSRRWLIDLAAVTNWAFALVSIIFIAYVPGFMNAFLIATLSLDRSLLPGLPRKRCPALPSSSRLTMKRVVSVTR